MVLVILAGVAAGMCMINSYPAGVRYEDGITASKGTVITPDESRLRAEHYVTSMKEYSGYNGTNLTLSEVHTLRCPSCWQFVYTFDIQSLKDPASTDRAVVGVTVESGKITDVFASYGIKNTGT